MTCFPEQKHMSNINGPENRILLEKHAPGHARIIECMISENTTPIRQKYHNSGEFKQTKNRNVSPSKQGVHNNRVQKIDQEH